jgi:Holliday junction resolvase RusA-like endonuclease
MNGRQPLTGTCAHDGAHRAADSNVVVGSQTRRSSHQRFRPTTRPDLDNYVKGALDAINGIVVNNDSQLVEIEAHKRYGIDPNLVLTVASTYTNG